MSHVYTEKLAGHWIIIVIIILYCVRKPWSGRHISRRVLLKCVFTNVQTTWRRRRFHVLFIAFKNYRKFAIFVFFKCHIFQESLCRLSLFTHIYILYGTLRKLLFPLKCVKKKRTALQNQSSAGSISPPSDCKKFRESISCFATVYLFSFSSGQIWPRAR